VSNPVNHSAVREVVLIDLREAGDDGVDVVVRFTHERMAPTIVPVVVVSVVVPVSGQDDSVVCKLLHVVFYLGVDGLACGAI